MGGWSGEVEYRCNAEEEEKVGRRVAVSVMWNIQGVDDGVLFFNLIVGTWLRINVV